MISNTGSSYQKATTHLKTEKYEKSEKMDKKTFKKEDTNELQKENTQVKKHTSLASHSNSAFSRNIVKTNFDLLSISKKTPKQSILGKKLFTQPSDKYRNTSSRPLYKVTSALVQTYMKINDSYYATYDKKQARSNDHYPINLGNVINGYKIIKILGRGAFGQVVEATKNNENVAIKIIKNLKRYGPIAQNEIKIIEMLNKLDLDDSKHIVRIKGHFIHEDHFCLVYEKLSFNLYELLNSTGFDGINLSLVREYSRQILIALSFLNKHSIIHADLKPEKYFQFNIAF